jgi:hypothetical protein
MEIPMTTTSNLIGSSGYSSDEDEPVLKRARINWIDDVNGMSGLVSHSSHSSSLFSPPLPLAASSSEHHNQTSYSNHDSSFQRRAISVPVKLDKLGSTSSIPRLSSFDWLLKAAEISETHMSKPKPPRVRAISQSHSMVQLSSLARATATIPRIPSHQSISSSRASSPSSDSSPNTVSIKKSRGSREKPIRPKVIESKGSTQCLGFNRKKKQQCRNAALMEYVGPRPLYCAEHIELDPKAMYHKCGFPTADARKLCKEIVYKEFGRCYKHFTEWLQESCHGPHAAVTASAHHTMVKTLLKQLEGEAEAAKHDDTELYQRKTKLIPKYVSMDSTLSAFIKELQQ